MTPTLIPTEFALSEAMRNMAINTILTLCEHNQLSPADVENIARQLAERDGIANALTGQINDNHSESY